jgi:hypothetical protein
MSFSSHLAQRRRNVTRINAVSFHDRQGDLTSRSLTSVHHDFGPSDFRAISATIVYSSDYQPDVGTHIPI